MKPFALLLAFALSLSAAAQADTTVITFEDATGPDLADGYGGISGWAASGFVFGGVGEGQGLQLFYGPSSGVLSFDAAPVVFKGIYFKTYAPIPDLATGISLFYRGQWVHSIADPHPPLGLQWVDSGYTGLVDQIRFQGGLEGFAIDNLTYASATLVPEPGSAHLLLAGLGLGLLGARRARRG